MPTRRVPELGTPGPQQLDDQTEQSDSSGWPRPVVDIRDDLVALAHDAYAAGRVVDPRRLDALADELAWAAAVARIYGGDATATEEFERAVRETAELARLTRQAVAA
jgi:hypothetical protein